MPGAGKLQFLTSFQTSRTTLLFSSPNSSEDLSHPVIVLFISQKHVRIDSEVLKRGAGLRTMGSRRSQQRRNQNPNVTTRKSTRTPKRVTFEDETSSSTGRDPQRRRLNNSSAQSQSANREVEPSSSEPPPRREPTPPPPQYFVKVNSFLNITQPKQRQVHVLARRYGAWLLADDPDDKLLDIHLEVKKAEHDAVKCEDLLAFYRESITAVVRVPRVAPSKIPVTKLDITAWTDVQNELEHLHTQYPSRPLSVDIDIITRFEPLQQPLQQPPQQPPSTTNSTIGPTPGSLSPSRALPYRDEESPSVRTPRRTRTTEMQASYERLRHQAELSAVIEKDLRQKWTCSSEHCRNRKNACYVYENTHYSMEPLQFREWAKAVKDEVTTMEDPPPKLLS